MSYKNPTFQEILDNSEGEIGEFFCKSYKNLATLKFYKTHNKRPTLDDAQELRDLFEKEWLNYYNNHREEKRNEKLSSQFFRYCSSIKVDCKKAVKQFCSERLVYSYIIDNKLFDDFKKYCLDNQKTLIHKWKPCGNTGDFFDKFNLINNND